MASRTVPHAGRPLVAPAGYGEIAHGAALVLAAAAYYLVPTTALSLLFLAALAYLVWRRSDLAVALIPLAVPFTMLPRHLHLVRHLDVSLGETAILLCSAVVLLQQLRSASARPPGVRLLRHLLPPSRFEAPALIFLAAATVAALGARFHTVAFREWREVILEPLLFYWLIVQRVRGAAGASRLVLAAIAAGTLVAALGVGQILFRPGDMAVALQLPGHPRLVRAVYGNENNLALLLDRAIPMALALALLPAWWGLLRAPTGPPSRAGSAPGERAVRVALILAAALMLYVLLRTDSRGGEATIAVVGVALFIYWQRARTRVLAATAALALLAAFVARHRLHDAITAGHGFATPARISIWLSALRMGRDHPLLGVGPDNFLYYYSDDPACAPGHIAAHYYRQQAFGAEPVNFERCVSHPHNMILDLWLSTGVVGLLAALALLALFAVLGIRTFRRAAPAWRAPLLAVLAAMLALVVHGQVDNSYFLPDLAVLFWLCIGVVALAASDAGSAEPLSAMA